MIDNPKDLELADNYPLLGEETIQQLLTLGIEFQRAFYCLQTSKVG